MSTRQPKAPVRALAMLALATSAASAQPCQFEWDASLASQDALINATLVFDDGSGPALYATGEFKYLGGSIVNGVAKWDGTRWLPLGDGFGNSSGVTGGIGRCLKSWDPDGAGPLAPKLIVGGSFITVNGLVQPAWNIAAWNPEIGWEPLGPGIPDEGEFYGWGVTRLETFPGPGGVERLFAFGSITDLTVNGLAGAAEWDGSQWIAMGDGLVPANGSPMVPYASTVHDDGTGPAVYIGGLFDGPLGVSGSENIAKWDGQEWRSVGETGQTLIVSGLASIDFDGPGPQPAKLAAVGGGVLRLFDGTDWSAPIPVAGTCNGWLSVCAAYNDGSGNKLYIAGFPCEGQAARCVRYNGTSFEDVGLPFPAGGVLDMGLRTINGVERLVIVGSAFASTGKYFGSAAILVNGQWEPVFPTTGPTARPLAGQSPFEGYYAQRAVEQLIVADVDAAGPASKKLYACGSFTAFGDVPAAFVAAHNGTSWESVGDFDPVTEPFPAIRHIVPVRTPAGDELYAISPVASAGSLVYVHKLVGSSWTVIGTYTNVGSFTAINFAKPVRLNPAREHLYVQVYRGGIGSQPNTTEELLYDGANWSPVGAAHAGIQLVDAIKFNSGAGLAAHAMRKLPGTFDFVPAYFDGTSWVNLPTTGLPSSFLSTSVRLVALGNTLYIYESWYGAKTSARLFRFHGSGWDAPVADSPIYPNLIGVADAGQGDRLYVLGLGHTWYSASIWAFDGVSWAKSTEMGDFVQGGPYSLARFDTQGQTSLWFAGAGMVGVGGDTTGTPDDGAMPAIGSFSIARWFCPTIACPADFNTSGSVTVQDIFDFLSAWFAGTPSADFNHIGGVTVQDIFDFLGAWFAGC